MTHEKIRSKTAVPGVVTMRGWDCPSGWKREALHLKPAIIFVKPIVSCQIWLTLIEWIDGAPFDGPTLVMETPSFAGHRPIENEDFRVSLHEKNTWWGSVALGSFDGSHHLDPVPCSGQAWKLCSTILRPGAGSSVKLQRFTKLKPGHWSKGVWIQKSHMCMGTSIWIYLSTFSPCLPHQKGQISRHAVTYVLTWSNKNFAAQLGCHLLTDPTGLKNSSTAEVVSWSVAESATRPARLRSASAPSGPESVLIWALGSYEGAT